MKSLKGHFLVASTGLDDPNFVRTVVFLVHHSEDGAFGVVLNRPAENTVKDLWQKVAEESCTAEQPAHWGGPVSGPLMAIHTDSSLGEMEIIPGVYFAAQREHLEKLVHQQEFAYRVFVGHSGWGGGQLESELEQGAWLTLPATAQFVFYDDADLWRQVTYRIGEALLASTLKIKHVPREPGLN